MTMLQGCVCAFRRTVARRLLWGLMLAASLPAMLPAGTAAAAEARYYEVPAGLLGAALSQFAGMAGVVLSFDASWLAGMRSPGLRGTFTVQQGFSTLLDASGFETAYDAGIYSLRRSPIGQSMLPTITVEGVRDQDPKDEVYRTAGSRSVLTREDIELNRGTSVGDIFRGTPGVLVGELRNSGGLDINIRGMQGQGRVPVLVDGARQETTVYRGYSGAVSRSYIDPDLIGGIQIDKGPTLSAEGTGATGGLVSMRTIKAEDIVRPGQDFGLRVRGQAIGNNSGSPVAADTPAGLYTGGTLGVAPVYRTDCVTAAACSGRYALPEEWGNPEGLDRPGTFRPKSYAGSLAIAKRWEKFDLVAAYAQREQGN